MADLEDIVQHVRVEGVGEVGSTFVSMAHDAESAFDKISKAAESGSSGLALFGKGVAGMAIALAAGAIALGEIESKAAETVVRLDALGTTFGTTAAGALALERAFQTAGVGPEKLERAMSRMSISVANSMAEIHRLQRTADTDQESATEGMVSANLQAQEAREKDADVSQEQSLKLRSDVLSVADAYHTLQFASQDMASTTANDMLSVGSAALSVKSSINQLEDAMRSTSVQAANLGAAGASLGVEEAQQRLSDLESGTPNKAANKDLQIRRARQQVSQAGLASQDANYKKETAPRDLELKQAQAQESLQKSIQALSDSLLKQQKDTTAPSAVTKAQLHLDEATFKQHKDFADSLLAPQKAANELASALTHVKEAAEKNYEVQLKNLALISAAQKGEGPLAGKLGDVSTGRSRLAMEAEAEKNKAGKEVTGEDVMIQLKKILEGGKLSPGQESAVVGPMTGTRQGRGAEEIVAALKKLDIKDIIGRGEKDQTLPQAPDVAKAKEVVEAQGNRDASLKEAALKTATAQNSIADLFINANNAIGDKVKEMMQNKVDQAAAKEATENLGKLSSSAGGGADSLVGLRGRAGDASDALGRFQSKLDSIALPQGGGGGGGEGGKANGGLISFARGGGVGSSSSSNSSARPSIPGFAEGGPVKGGSTTVTVDWTTALQKISGIIKGIVDTAMELTKAAQQEQDRADFGHAGGGHIRGPGSGTSDSILARLSNGEFVVRAAAVRAYGTDMFERLNSMQFPGFAGGGPVVAGVRPASSGAQKPGSTLNLHIDGHEFNGLHAPQDVAEKLTDFAIRRQTSSAGRRPSWDR